jgi:hypothetical protein
VDPPVLKPVLSHTHAHRRSFSLLKPVLSHTHAPRACPACSLADPLPLSTRTPRHRRKQFRFYPFFVCAWRAGEATWRDRENNRCRAACAWRVQAAQALRQQRGAQGALRRARWGGSSSPTDGTTYRKVRTQISPPLPRRCFRIWWRRPDEEHRGRYLHTVVP